MFVDIPDQIKSLQTKTDLGVCSPPPHDKYIVHVSYLCVLKHPPDKSIVHVSYLFFA